MYRKGLADVIVKIGSNSTALLFLGKGQLGSKDLVLCHHNSEGFLPQYQTHDFSSPLSLVACQWRI